MTWDYQSKEERPDFCQHLKSVDWKKLQRSYLYVGRTDNIQSSPSPTEVDSRRLGSLSTEATFSSSSHAN